VPYFYFFAKLQFYVGFSTRKIGFIFIFTQGVAVGLGYKWFSTILQLFPTNYSKINPAGENRKNKVETKVFLVLSTQIQQIETVKSSNAEFGLK